MDDILRYEYRKGERQVFPIHPSVKNWLFDEQTEDEAKLAHFMAVVAEKNGMGANELHHLFPAVLRMLKSDTIWAK